MPIRSPSRLGFTLIELMVLITIFTAMLVVAVPPVSSYLRSNELEASADRLAADLHYARSVSIANGRIMRFQGVDGGYTITDPVSGDVLRNHNFGGGCTFDLDVDADFFPWGMADAVVINMSSCAGTRTINVLPTGIVEVP